MAKTGAVWGIDIGQCAIKALRCRPHDDDPTRITADAFDYIEYPKILSQPEADPAELIREALELFLSRNTVLGDRVATSVSGQSGLARFIKLPPVESKKIPDIVKYEARQQIPFALEDVVWDYQQMAGGSEEEGFALETEVGLFALKRDQVYRALKPFEDAGIEVDIIQLTPLALYNFTVFDQMPGLPPVDKYDPDNPPESVIVLSVGTDTTDLVISNGYRVWQRSVAIGGSHFTKALSKELRLTFAKAEHLKRHATQAEDPKAVFQAMRPVFNDLLTHIQQSIGYFVTNIDRTAQINRVLALGNAMKLPGLQKYLSQNLGYPISEVSGYRGINGASVTDAPAFKENLLSFAVAYGLALQGLSKGKLSTNLLPREIVTERTIRAKKPWVVATAAALLLGCTVNFLGHWRAWGAVHPKEFANAFPRVDAIEMKSKDLTTQFEEQLTRFKSLDKIGQNIVGNVDGRLVWLEVLKAIGVSLPPRFPRGADQKSSVPGKTVEELTAHEDLHIEHIDCQFLSDVRVWYDGVVKLEQYRQRAAQESAQAPSGEGWIIEVSGYHFHNAGRSQGALFVDDTLVRNLEIGTVQLPAGKELVQVSLKDLGIRFPLQVTSSDIRRVTYNNPDPATEGNSQIPLQRYDFVVQFCWQPTPLSKRLENQSKPHASGGTTQAPEVGLGGE